VARFLVVREVTRCPATQQRKQASHNQRMRCDVKRREKCDLIDTIVLTWGFATARTLLVAVTCLRSLAGCGRRAILVPGSYLAINQMTHEAPPEAAKGLIRMI
jgi:hypothetical protein